MNIALFLEIALKVAGFFLDRSSASSSTKRAFWEAVSLAGKDNNSAKLMLYAEKQHEYLVKEQWKETT